MSDKTANSPVAAVPENEKAPETAEKPSLVQRGKTFVKNHKKSTIAVGSLVALVGVASLAGRKTEPLPDFETPSTPEPEVDETVTESDDTNVA